MKKNLLKTISIGALLISSLGLFGCGNNNDNKTTKTVNETKVEEKKNTKSDEEILKEIHEVLYSEVTELQLSCLNINLQSEEDETKEDRVNKGVENMEKIFNKYDLIIKDLEDKPKTKVKMEEIRNSIQEKYDAVINQTIGDPDEIVQWGLDTFGMNQFGEKQDNCKVNELREVIKEEFGQELKNRYEKYE